MTTEAKWSDFASMDGAKTLAAANRLLPAWVSLLLIVVIAWQLARIVWMLVPGPSAGDTVTAPANGLVAASQSDSSADLQAIVTAHMFGIADADPDENPQPLAEDTSNLRDTRLVNLLLKGTIAATREEMAIAIIADNNDEEKVYTIGDPVTSGADLHAVYADRVVLNENGVLTNLKLPKDFPAGTPTIARRNITTTSRATNSKQSIQAVVAQNVSKLADVIRPTPYFVNGQQQGYRVYPGRNRQQFAALGLRPGDLIKDIDGQALTDPTQAMQIFQSLDSADQVSVTVERNGQPQVIVLSTSQLDLGDETSQ
ncbi:MAG: type II secretion system protein GspC [Gammaproteobacteria bacterium]|nr:type II secretion system protein GspC [Gammaproteobacteria bacterium]MDH3750962.1 type II secretion system protein GspC [Gammaproteobacteria bacterium]MDH3804161.1 type II secretion system protein GspC [Gammaproteobacteria bacterium]